MITEEQREARRHSIGASDTPAILGLSSYAGPYSVWLEKLGDAPARGRSADEERRLDWGNDLELAVVERARKDLGVPIQFSPDTRHFDSEGTPLHANIDGLIERAPSCVADFLEGWDGRAGPGVLEIKSGDQQDWHSVQVLHQLVVTDLYWGLIARTEYGRPPTYEVVVRDDETWAAHVSPHLRAFWRAVTARQPPAPTWADTVAHAAEQAAESIVDLPAAAERWVADACEAARRKREAEKAEASLKNRLRLALGANVVGRLPSGERVTWKPNNKGTRVLRLPRR